MTSKTLQERFQRSKLKVMVNPLFMVSTVLLLSAGSIASAATHSSFSKTAKAAAFGAVYDQEYAYGFEEGRRYARAHNEAGYQYMLKHYRDAWQMYPENGEFYRGRIDGLMAGYSSTGGLP